MDTTSCQQRTCEAIEGDAFDFTAKFYAAYDLHALAKKEVAKVTPRAIEAIQALLLSTTFTAQRQSLFLYREAASVLATIIQMGADLPIARLAQGALQAVLRHAHGKAHQAAAEALGSLPLGIKGPQLPSMEHGALPRVSWDALLSERTSPALSSFKSIGRCRVAPLTDNQHLLVIKLARSVDDLPGLQREIQWMDYLANCTFEQTPRFDIPQPLMVDGQAVFQLKPCDALGREGATRAENAIAIGFVAAKDYFLYPNTFDSQTPLAPPQLIEVMGRSAFWMGYLVGQGIVHEAPIPLFHNRVQQERRRDGGLYEWYRGGRLDRWLDSCAYPNFGVSGLRDFEHFSAFNGDSLSLYRNMGNHLLSLLLVAGSYFRTKAPTHRGWDANQHPVDARDQFDPSLLRHLIHTLFDQYRFGFTGKNKKGTLPIDEHHLAQRMIEEMGVDRHMEEYLRVADQQQMTQADFEDFLTQRGYAEQAIAEVQKGSRDLAIQSGPHLGAFNRPISLPELIEAVAAMAATFVLDRFVASDAN